MSETILTQPEPTAVVPSQKIYTRFDLSERVEHFILLISFSILGFTGLIQKYATSPYAQYWLGMLGGIEKTRLIHRAAAIVLMAVSIYHLIALIYRVWVLKAPPSMVPLIEDFKHLIQDLEFYIGRRARRAYYRRYSYAEKVEYLAVVWGTVIMAITGFMMWNPIATTRWLRGEFIPAAKAAHGAEAVLAVLSILLWHFYHVHLRHFNKSMFTGKMTEEEMQHEHPAELAEIKANLQRPTEPVSAVRRRQQYYLPVALVLTAVFSYGLVKFVSFEQTAITTIPKGETAPIFVPITPTPAPTPTARPGPVPGAGMTAATWEGGFGALFGAKCGTCHGPTRMGGLDLTTYQAALQGGQSGPAIVPGNPDGSLLVQKQSSGSHPGQLTIDELQQVISWIAAGAPEK